MMKFLSPEQCDKIFDDLLLELENEDNHIVTYKKISDAFGDHFVFSTSFGGNEKDDFLVYRVVKQYEGLTDKMTDPKSFSYNAKPPLGRANLKNKPVFYCSFSARTAIEETKKLNDEAYYISTWRINGRKITESFLLLYDSVGRNDFFIENIHSIINFNTEQTKEPSEWFKYKLKKITDLFTHEGDRFYNISSAIAYKLLYDTKEQGIDIPWLIYPSVAKKQIEYNLAIHPLFVDNPDYFNLVSVIKCTLYVSNNNKLKGNILSKATLKADKLKWDNIQTKSFDIDYKNTKITIDENKDWIQVDAEKIRIQINHKKTNLKDYLQETYVAKLTFDNNINLNGLNIFDSSKEYTLKRNLVIRFDGDCLILNKESHHIKAIILKINILIEFK